MSMSVEDAKRIERVQHFIERTQDGGKSPEATDWMSFVMPHITVHSHSSAMPHPRINFRFTVQPVHCNQMRNLHGGCTASIFDVCTSLLLHLISKPGFWMLLGVSRTLNCTYLRPIPVGSTIDIECTVLQIGKKLCSLKGEMRAVDENGTVGALLAVCEHGKVSTDPVVEKL
ncbi:HotDog domain-containing protein [Xylariales sp. AK1849]|nr:HotDog domain-containing protein [Xylariales sp. AK1849]